MHPIEIIRKYYNPGSQIYHILVTHSTVVAQKALEIARKNPHLLADTDFIWEASMLHDIGIFLTNSPVIHCHGEKPYICHGYLGRELLEKEGYPKHALVCERHTGVGLTQHEIIEQKLPIPVRDMTPQTIEEIIICFADTFFSKSKHIKREKSVSEVLKTIAKHGERNVKVFTDWVNYFSYK